ncbi:MAG: SIS domain-containing protein [Thermofilaceae archaeon]|nr:SIS domain-containing protein [Thermofilaceae archaeon]MDW8003435.1 SIS domain-containing protein [Thermofilaceae archaeon]
MAEKSKGEYMGRELAEGPDAVTRTIREAVDQVKAAASLLKELEANGVKRGYVIGSGTSFHASLFLQHLFSKYTDFHLAAVPASEFTEWRPAKGKYFIIGYSQSGESSDIVEAFNVARTMGVKTIAITNTFGSTLSRISDAAIVTRAGEEKAVAATKTFDVQLAAALALVYTLTGKVFSEIERASEAAREVLAKKNLLREVAERYVKAEHAFSLGRGAGYPIALEAALKLKEAAMVHAEGFAVREFLHGPLQLVDEGTPVFLFAPSRASFEASIKALERIAGYKAPIILVGPKASEFKDYASYSLEVTGAGEDANVIPLVKVAQVFAFYISVLKGLDPDKPTKLSKVVKY